MTGACRQDGAFRDSIRRLPRQLFVRLPSAPGQRLTGSLPYRDPPPPPSAAPANWQNRTLFQGDNLDILRAMNSGSVDLIATDPPFNKGRDFHATPDSLTAGSSFQDRWSWEGDVHAEWVDQIKDDHPNVMHVIQSSRQSYDDGMGAYLCFMAVRLLEMQRVLKQSGSIYLHCDPTASHYLKALMDATFGKANFRNEIVWSYRTGGVSKKHWPRKHDVLLFYAMPKYKHRPLQERIYYDKAFFSTHTDDSGRHFADVYVRDVWDDIKPIINVSKERTGYPTQKPWALYERIVKASSSEDGIVLDPFCGCATTCVAAERTGRQWVGIDLWKDARDTLAAQMGKNGVFIEGFDYGASEFKEKLRKAGMGDEPFVQRLGEGGRPIDVHWETNPPERTDAGETAADPFLTPVRRVKEPWERLSRSQITDHLAAAQSGSGPAPRNWIVCAGCGRTVERAFTQLDHIQPKSDRGRNDITNRILLCSPCNLKKSDRLTLSGLVKQNRKDNWMEDEAAAVDTRNRAASRAEAVRNGQELFLSP